MQTLASLTERYAEQFGLAINTIQVRLIVTGTGPERSVILNGLDAHPSMQHRHLGEHIKDVGGDDNDVTLRIAQAKTITEGWRKFGIEAI